MSEQPDHTIMYLQVRNCSVIMCKVLFRPHDQVAVESSDITDFTMSTRSDSACCRIPRYL